MTVSSFCSYLTKVWLVRGLCSCCCHVLCTMSMRRLWRIGRYGGTCCCLLRNLLSIALDVVWPVAEFGCVIEQKSGGARDFETLDTSTDKVLCAGVRISIETTSFADTIKSVSRSDVMSSFYGWWSRSFIKKYQWHLWTKAYIEDQGNIF